jgi:hypothetical protein
MTFPVPFFSVYFQTDVRYAGTAIVFGPGLHIGVQGTDIFLCRLFCCLTRVPLLEIYYIP